MNKKDFNYGNKELYIEDNYVLENSQYILIIDSEIFNEETIEYANNLIKKFEKEKDNTLNYMLNIGLRDFYSNFNYSDEQIKSSLGRPQINIIYKKDDKHPDWQFNYFGVIEFCENTLDEHIISIEFIDDLQLDKHVQLDG